MNCETSELVKYFCFYLLNFEESSSKVTLTSMFWLADEEPAPLVASSSELGLSSFAPMRFTPPG